MSGKKPTEPTIQERKWAKAYVQTGNKVEAVRRVYNTKTPDSAVWMAKEISNRPRVKEYVQALLEEEGLTLPTLAKQLNTSINYNLDNGKASQAVGADLLKFSFLLHDAVPATKTLNANLNLTQQTPAYNDMKGLTKALEDNLESTKLLLDELKKEASSK